MVHLEQKRLRNYLHSCDSDVILVSCECVHDILPGHLRVKLGDLESYKNIFEGTLKIKSSVDK